MPNSQIDLFSFSMPRFHIGNKKIRLIELFAGIGAQAKALENLGVPFEHYKVVEIDKYAVASYNAIHGTNFEPTDICQVHASDLEIRERERYCYIMTYSFPCQDISGAGHGKGFDKNSNTRSGLLWEVERILDECDELPQVLIMENVPMILSKKHIGNFQLWRRKLESLGYSNYVQLLNAKDYGIPQNRNRCFMVSILGDYYYEFPKKQKLELRLKDMLEDNVDEMYYLSDKQIQFFVANTEKNKAKGNGFKFEPLPRERERVSKTIQTKMDRPEVEYIEEFVGGGLSKEEQVNINPTESTLTQTKHPYRYRQGIGKNRSRLSNTIRSSGRGSLDRHSWDVILEDSND